jgi:hypothetical protein
LQSGSDRTLYDVLAEHAPAGAPCGETMGSRNKETIDQDAEVFDPVEPQLVVLVSDPTLTTLLTVPAPPGVTAGETRTDGETNETIDDDQKEPSRATS